VGTAALSISKFVAIKAGYWGYWSRAGVVG